MTSDRRAAANRNNAKKSTGPTTAAGKARASRNSLKHGLNVPVSADASLTPHIERWVQAFSSAGRGDPATIRAAAEQQVHILRIRAIRKNTLSMAATPREPLEGPDDPEPKPLDDVVADAADELAKLDAYERKALSRRNRLLRRLSE